LLIILKLIEMGREIWWIGSAHHFDSTNEMSLITQEKQFCSSKNMKSIRNHKNDSRKGENHRENEPTEKAVKGSSWSLVSWRAKEAEKSITR
jgi:hypothetical protein